MLALALLPAAAAAQGEDPPVLSGPAEVVDGDTVKIDGTRIRLFGIDAPEMSEWPWGPRARSALEDLVEGRTVTCLQRDTDRYDRAVAICATAETPDLAEAMIAGGHAIAYRRFTAGTELHGPYLAAEASARNAGIGPMPLADPDWLSTIDRFQSGIAALVGVLGGLVAIVTGALFNAGLVRRRDRALRREETAALADAFIGEIGAATTLIERRRMVERYEETLTALGAGPASIPRWTIRSDYFAVFRANAGKLGLLPDPAPGRIAGWYALATSFVETMNNMTDEDLTKYTPENLRRAIKEYLIEDLRDLLVTGAALIELLGDVRDGRTIDQADHGDRQSGNGSSAS